MSVEDKDEKPESSHILRHRALVPDDAISPGDAALIDAIDHHVQQHIGSVDVVFDEIVSPYVHVDIHHVPPRPEQPFHVLVTSGMSEMPMMTPEPMEEYRYAEVLVCLPPEWPVTQEAFQDERNYWPIRALKRLARLPHEFSTWLGWGHTVPNGDPPQSFASNTELCGMLVLPSLSLPEEAFRMELSDGRTIHFWSLVPVHADEMALKLKKGTEALLPLFDRHGITDVIDPSRSSVVGRRRLWPFRS
jgi:hypothetical protein